MLINVEEIMELENHHLWYTIVITVTEDAKTCKWTIDKKKKNIFKNSWYLPHKVLIMKEKK